MICPKCNCLGNFRERRDKRPDGTVKITVRKICNACLTGKPVQEKQLLTHEQAMKALMPKDENWLTTVTVKKPTPARDPVVRKKSKPEKKCPNCGKVGEIETDFGWRNLRGEIKPQSWCIECR